MCLEWLSFTCVNSTFFNYICFFHWLYSFAPHERSNINCKSIQLSQCRMHKLNYKILFSVRNYSWFVGGDVWRFCFITISWNGTFYKSYILAHQAVGELKFYSNNIKISYFVKVSVRESHGSDAKRTPRTALVNDIVMVTKLCIAITFVV